MSVAASQSAAEKKFSTLANFNERQDSLSDNERKLNAKAYFIEASQKETFTIKAKARVEAVNGDKAALGGVFTAKGKVPIQR